MSHIVHYKRGVQRIRYGGDTSCVELRLPKRNRRLHSQVSLSAQSVLSLINLAYIAYVVCMILCDTTYYMILSDVVEPEESVALRTVE